MENFDKHGCHRRFEYQSINLFVVRSVMLPESENLPRTAGRFVSRRAIGCIHTARKLATETTATSGHAKQREIPLGLKLW